MQGKKKGNMLMAKVSTAFMSEASALSQVALAQDKLILNAFAAYLKHCLLL